VCCAVCGGCDFWKYVKNPKKHLTNKQTCDIINTERNKTKDEVKTMMELICAIPEELGWTMVGLALGAVVNMGIKLGKIFVEMWKDYHEDEESEE
jgi:hypothetical protein